MDTRVGSFSETFIHVNIINVECRNELHVEVDDQTAVEQGWQIWPKEGQISIKWEKCAEFDL